MRQFTNAALSQFYSQESEDPFLMLVELSHANFSTVYLVNNSENVISNSNEYVAFPMTITLPADDGQSQPGVNIVFDNVSQELIDEIRSVTDPVSVNIRGVLASNPDIIEIEIGEMKLKNVSYNVSSINASLYFDDFMNTELPGEKYIPTNYAGLFN